MQIGNWDGAIADFDKAIAINAKSSEAYNGRGLVRYYKGELDQALADYNKALELEPNAAITYNNRALALVGKETLIKRWLITISPSHLMARMTWSIPIEVTCGIRKETGTEPLLISIRRSPSIQNPLTHTMVEAPRDILKKSLTRQLLISTRLSRSIRLPLATLTGVMPDQKSDYDGALADFEKAISLDPKSADAYNGRGARPLLQGQLR